MVVPPNIYQFHHILKKEAVNLFVQLLKPKSSLDHRLLPSVFFLLCCVRFRGFFWLVGFVALFCFVCLDFLVLFL